MSPVAWKVVVLALATLGALWSLSRAGGMPNPDVFRLATIGILAIVVLVVLVF